MEFLDLRLYSPHFQRDHWPQRHAFCWRQATRARPPIRANRKKNRSTDLSFHKKKCPLCFAVYFAFGPLPRPQLSRKRLLKPAPPNTFDRCKAAPNGDHFQASPPEPVRSLYFRLRPSAEPRPDLGRSAARLHVRRRRFCVSTDSLRSQAPRNQKHHRPGRSSGVERMPAGENLLAPSPLTVTLGPAAVKFKPPPLATWKPKTLLRSETQSR